MKDKRTPEEIEEQNGFMKKLILIIVVALLIGIGIAWFYVGVVS